MTEPILAGKVALITGGGRGIGRATAILFAARGARVAVAARTAREVEETTALIHKSGGTAMAVAADISDPSAVSEMFKRVRSEYGPPDLLINNASVLGTLGMTWRVEPDEWFDVIRVNLYGTFLCIRAAIPAMLERGSGKIASVSSGVAAYDLVGSSAYNASKSALERFCTTVAEEVSGTGVDITLLRPSRVETRMQSEIRGAEPQDFPRVEEWREVHRRGELLNPSTPAAGLLWLCSSFSNGSNGKRFDIKEGGFRERIQRDLGIQL